LEGKQLKQAINTNQESPKKVHVSLEPADQVSPTLNHDELCPTKIKETSLAGDHFVFADEPVSIINLFFK
jgi:hypothetical protein